MSNYAIFFVLENTPYKLPTNPDKIEIKSNQAIEKYEVLKLGQISIPTHLELSEYSFECELPKQPYSYAETSNEFKDADFYLNSFVEWRKSKVPVRFIASNGISKDINTLVLIKDLTITEKAGEEGDKYVKFSLIEYKEYSKKTGTILKENTTEPAANEKNEIKLTKEVASTTAVNPSNNGFYIVQKGDSLYKIAKKLYGDGAKSNIIFNANKDKIKNPAIIGIGWQLKIPNKDEFNKYSAPLPKTVPRVQEKKVVTEVAKEVVENKGVEWKHWDFTKI